MARLSLLSALVLACVSFPSICSVGENDKEGNAEKKTEVCYHYYVRSEKF